MYSGLRVATHLLRRFASSPSLLLRPQGQGGRAGAQEWFSLRFLSAPSKTGVAAGSQVRATDTCAPQ